MATCQPFSIMRLTHEAIREGLNKVESLANQLNAINAAELQAAFKEVKRVIELHASQEDEKFYPPLAEKEPGITEAFTGEHEDESKVFKRIEEALTTIQTDAFQYPKAQKLLLDWVADHRKHLEHEEGVLMQLLPKVFSYVESVSVVRGILAHDVEEFESFQLPWVFERLKTPQRTMYLGMLKGCSPEGKFDDFLRKVTPLMKPEELESLSL